MAVHFTIPGLLGLTFAHLLRLCWGGMLLLMAKMKVGDNRGFQLSCLSLTSITKDNQKLALAIF